MVTWSQTFTDSHKQEMVFCVQNCSEHQSHTYTTMTVTITNITISLTQPKYNLIGLSGI